MVNGCFGQSKAQKEYLKSKKDRLRKLNKSKSAAYKRGNKVLYNQRKSQITALLKSLPKGY